MNTQPTSVIASAFAPPTMITLTNTGKTPKHFVLIDGRIPPSEIERDPTKIVEISTINGPTKVAAPVLYGPDRQRVGARNIPPHKQSTRQLRELHVDIAPGASVQVPRSYLLSLFAIRCELCATPTAGLGCRHLDDPDHIAQWTVTGARLACISWCECAELKHVNVDAGYVAGLETSRKDGVHNRWGAPR